MRKNEISSNKLLKVLVVAGVISIAAVNPFFGVLASYVASDELKKQERKKLQNSFYYLKHRGFVDSYRKPNGSWVVKLTRKGRLHAQRYQLEEIIINAPARWDKKWRIVAFDIPSDKSRVRFTLLSKLKDLGFVMLQKSVWAHPFKCEKEIENLAKICEVEKHISILVCDSVSYHNHLKQKFEERNNFKLI